jgi:ABC-type glutathione transport system ATPase component
MIPAPPSPLLEAHNLVKQYGSSTVVDDVSLTLHRGETLGLVGESGSGKSTVARLLLRLIEPTSGQITLHPPQSNGDPENLSSRPERSGVERPPNFAPAQASTNRTRTLNLLDLTPRDLRRLRRRLAIVFQDPYAALDPRMTVRQILAEPFAIHREQPPQGLTPRLHEMLAEVGLDPSALPRYPHEFSGGQRQRINIARALALRPELLVLDEPVSALDVSVGAQVINLLRDLQARHGLTCLFISHSMPLVRYLCHRVAVMQRGRIVEQGTWQEVCDHPTEAYTQQLLAATPELPVGV